MPATEQRRWTAREVRALIDAQPTYTPRVELVDGELLVTPSPSFLHQRAVQFLLVALHLYLRGERVGEAVASPADVELEPEFLSQPDVYVLPIGEVRRLLAEGNPARRAMLTIEVLSPSSRKYDRITKRPAYLRNVPEYWIVDLEAELVERWRQGTLEPDILTTRLDWLPAGATTPFSLDLLDFFRRVHTA